MNYFQQKQFLAQVDKNDKIIEKIEKWKAHKKGILHRAFSLILTYKDKYVVQHRKHVAFDGVYDLTFSSHQIYINNVLQTDLEAIYASLKREWNLREKDLKTIPEFLGKIYYKAKDPKSTYSEHEVDYIFQAQVRKPPRPNPDFAYASFLLEKKDFQRINFAPWVRKILQEKMLK